MVERGWVSGGYEKLLFCPLVSTLPQMASSLGSNIEKGFASRAAVPLHPPRLFHYLLGSFPLYHQFFPSVPSVLACPVGLNHQLPNEGFSGFGELDQVKAAFSGISPANQPTD